MLSTAIIDGPYRYALTRRWGNGPALNIVMLNSSTADAQKDDPTIRHCIRIATTWGYDAIMVMNLFAWRTPRPELLLKVADPIGPDNDDHLRKLKGTTLCAWGAHGKMMHRDELAPLPPVGDRVILGRSPSGMPLHPHALSYLGRPDPEAPIPWR